MTRLARLIADDRGVTAIEYSLLAALIGLGMVAAADQLGARVADGFEKVAKELGVSPGKGWGPGGKPGKGKP